MLRVAALLALLLCCAQAGFAQTWQKPVKVVADETFTITTPAGSGAVPVYTSPDWPQPPPYVGSAARLEADFARRDVIYLPGTADTDPHHPDSDMTAGTCSRLPVAWLCYSTGQVALACEHLRD